MSTRVILIEIILKPTISNQKMLWIISVNQLLMFKNTVN